MAVARAWNEISKSVDITIHTQGLFVDIISWMESLELNKRKMKLVETIINNTGVCFGAFRSNWSLGERSIKR